MAPHRDAGVRRGKSLRASARFLAVYGRLPTEFDPDTAMDLHANIPAVEAAHTMATAKAIAIALGDAKALAECVYLTTGDAAMAQRVEIRARMERGLRG